MPAAGGLAFSVPSSGRLSTELYVTVPALSGEDKQETSSEVGEKGKKRKGRTGLHHDETRTELHQQIHTVLFFQSRPSYTSILAL